MSRTFLQKMISLCVWIVVLSITSFGHAQQIDCPADMSHYWRLDESSQPYVDSYGTNHATCTNCPNPTTGIANGAQQFSLTSQVNVPDDNTFDWGVSESFSIEFWMKTDSSSTCSGNQVMAGRTSPFWWVGCLSNTGLAYFELNDTSGNGTAVAGHTDLTDGNWHHIVAIRDSSQVRLYVDGIIEGSSNYTYSSGFSSTSALTMGWLNLGGGYHFIGNMDEVALYNRTLSETEIFNHYYLGRGYCDMCASPVKIMLLGDSITYGRNDQTLEPQEQNTPNYVVGYRQSLYLSLLNNDYYVNFVGGLKDGELATPSFDLDHQGIVNTMHAFTAQDLATNVHNLLSANPTDVILLHIGTNNILNTTATDIENILDEIDRYDTDITVLLARIINVQDSNDPRSAYITQFNDDVATMVMNRTSDKIILVDQENTLSYPDDMYNMLHPNAIGFEKMANTWLSTLNTFLPACGSVAPTFTSNPATIATVNQLYMYYAEATGNPYPSYSLITAPAGMTIDQTSGIISWTPLMQGSFDVVVLASNTEGVDTQSFAIEGSTCPADMSHYWRLDESSQPYVDSYGTNHATCTNCPTPTLGILNGAQQFSLTSQVNVPDDNTFDWGVSESFSIEFWMKTDSSSTCSGNQVMAGRTSPFWWVGCLSNTGLAYFELNDTSGNGTAVTGHTDLTDGNWHHIVAVRDSYAIHLYVDGFKHTAYTVYASGFDSASVPLTAGWLNLGGGYHFIGNMDEIALYNRALSDVEIQQHYLSLDGYCGVQSLYTLTLDGSGNGSGTVTGTGINCIITSGVTSGDCSEIYNAYIPVTMNSSADSGSVFAGWSGACTGTGSCNLTMDGDKNVTASFLINTYTVTGSAPGGHGTISCVPSPVNSGASSTCTMTPDASYYLSALTDNGANVLGSVVKNQFTISNVTANHVVIATFSINTYNLSITKSGPGNGTITSTPSGINCGNDCSEVFSTGASVTLTAAPSSDSVFTGWSGGGCSGTGNCTVTMNSSITVTATFQGKYFISGTVRAPSGSSPGNPIPGATVTLGGDWSGTTITDKYGNYQFSGLPNGNYSLTPSMLNYIFTPANRAVALTNRNMYSQNFTGTYSVSGIYSISGRVLTPQGNPISGAMVALTGSTTGTTLTDILGNYTFSGLSNGNYTVTPGMTGYTFSPEYRTVTISGVSMSGQNFTGTPSGGGIYSISGSVRLPSGSVPGKPVPGVVMTLTGDATGTVTTDNYGNYTFRGLPNGSFTITASKTGYTFTPSERNVTIDKRNVYTQDFMAILE